MSARRSQSSNVEQPTATRRHSNETWPRQAVSLTVRTQEESDGLVLSIDAGRVRKIAELVRGHERSFASRLAHRVIPARQVTLWIMVIPMILVLHLLEMWRLAAARREFTRHFMVAVDRALHAAIDLVVLQSEPDYRELAATSTADDHARRAHERLLRLMVEYYEALLRADGSCFEALIRNAYSSRETYLLEMEERDRAIRAFGERVQAALPADNAPSETRTPAQEQAYREVLEGMAKASADLRRRDAERFFAQRRTG